MPIDPCAPGFDSIMTCWPHSSESFWPSTRPIRSDDPPGGYVTISRGGLDGNVWATALPAHTTATMAKIAADACLRCMVFLLWSFVAARRRLEAASGADGNAYPRRARTDALRPGIAIRPRPTPESRLSLA